MAYLDDAKALRDALMSMMLTDALAEKATVVGGGTVRVSYRSGSQSVQWNGTRKEALETIEKLNGLIAGEEIPEADVRVWS